MESPKTDAVSFHSSVPSSLHTVGNVYDGSADSREKMSPCYSLPKEGPLPNATSTAVKQWTHKTSSIETPPLMAGHGRGLTHHLDSPMLGGSLGSGRGSVQRQAEALSPRPVSLPGGSQPNCLDESTESMDVRLFLLCL